MPSERSGPTSIDWDHLAREHAQSLPLPDRFLAGLAAFGVGHPGQRVLDLGSGSGEVARSLARRRAVVSALDSSPGWTALARDVAARERVPIEHLVGAAEDTGLPCGSFDVVIANRSWSYFDGHRVAAEARRLLAPGGQLVLSHQRWLSNRDPLLRLVEDSLIGLNPRWQGVPGPADAWPRRMELAGSWSCSAMFFIDERIPWSRSTFQGWIRSSVVLGDVEPERVRSWLARDLDSLLAQHASDPFEIPFRFEAEFYTPVPSTATDDGARG